MAFNIRNDQTHALAREVADLTGESMAQAVDKALRERRERLGRHGIAARLREISALAAERVPKKARSSDAAALYDERGLPR